MANWAEPKKPALLPSMNTDDAQGQNFHEEPKTRGVPSMFPQYFGVASSWSQPHSRRRI
jgi:hypothetical protein